MVQLLFQLCQLYVSAVAGLRRADADPVWRNCITQPPSSHVSNLDEQCFVLLLEGSRAEGKGKGLGEAWDVEFGVPNPRLPNVVLFDGDLEAEVVDDRFWFLHPGWSLRSKKD